MASFKDIYEQDKKKPAIKAEDIKVDEVEVTPVDISKLLVVMGWVKSRGEANRLIAQGAVSIDGEKILGSSAHIKIGSIIKVGKRRFAKVINTDTITP